MGQPAFAFWACSSNVAWSTPGTRARRVIWLPRHGPARFPLVGAHVHAHVDSFWHESRLRELVADRHREAGRMGGCEELLRARLALRSLGASSPRDRLIVEEPLVAALTAPPPLARSPLQWARARRIWGTVSLLSSGWRCMFARDGLSSRFDELPVGVVHGEPGTSTPKPPMSKSRLVSESWSSLTRATCGIARSVSRAGASK